MPRTTIKTRIVPTTEFNQDGSALESPSQTHDADEFGIGAPRKTQIKSLMLGLTVACLTCLVGITSVVAGWQTLPSAVLEVITLGAAVAALRKGYEVF